MPKRIAKVLPVIFLLLTGLLAFAPVGTASAHSAVSTHSASTVRQVKRETPDFCQGNGSQLELYYEGSQYAYNCSGYFGFDGNVNYGWSGNWSGYLFISYNGGTGTASDFCNKEYLYVGDHLLYYVYYIYLSPTKEPWC